MKNIILADKKYLKALLAHPESESCPALLITRIYLDNSGVIYCYIRIGSCRRNEVFSDKIFHSLSVTFSQLYDTTLVEIIWVCG